MTDRATSQLRDRHVRRGRRARVVVVLAGVLGSLGLAGYAASTASTASTAGTGAAVSTAAAPTTQVTSWHGDDDGPAAVAPTLQPGTGGASHATTAGSTHVATGATLPAGTTQAPAGATAPAGTTAQVPAPPVAPNGG